MVRVLLTYLVDTEQIEILEFQTWGSISFVCLFSTFLWSTVSTLTTVTHGDDFSQDIIRHNPCMHSDHTCEDSNNKSNENSCLCAHSYFSVCKSVASPNMQGQSVVPVCKYEMKYARPVFGPSNHNPGSKQSILGMPVLSDRKTLFYIRDG